MEINEDGIEVWHSSKDREEWHFYLSDTDKYVFGCSPKYVSKEQLRKIMKILDIKIDEQIIEQL